MVYVFGNGRDRPKLLWQFETGSLGYGCGMKSLHVKNKRIAFELFGTCQKNPAEPSASGKFTVEDTTRFVFGFDGKKLVREKSEVFAVPARSTLNYKSEISISE